MARSAWMSWLVIATIAVSLSILGGFWLIMQDLRSVSHEVGGTVPAMVFCAPDADPRGMEMAIKEIPGVVRVTVIPKEQAWKQMQEDFKTKMTFDKLLDDNPLPDTIKVETDNPDVTPAVADRISKLQGVEEVSYGKELLEKIASFSAFIRTAGLALSGILGVASLAVIMNTIRLAVMGRRREIEIMHLVGASNSFIAWPFLLEGMLFGLFGACLTGVILAGWRYFTIQKWQELFPFVHMTPDYFALAQILTWLALIGMSLGAVGSALSVRKHIRLAMAD
jgi:cell division transport system permease protein